MEVPTIWRRPEARPEAVDAWRAWAIVELDGALRLSSLTRPERWDPRTPVTAICRHPTHLRPRRFCTCGVYAVPRPELLAGLGPIAGGVIGQVSLWGRIVEHERGLRAEAAYPARLGLVCVTCLAERTGRRADVVEREERAPGVAILRPLCGDHASGAQAMARSASEVEAALRDAYVVDPLPPEVIERISRGRPEIEGAETARRRRMALVRVAALAVAAVLAWPAVRALEPAALTSPAAPSSPSENPFEGGILLGASSAGSYLSSYPQHRLTLKVPAGLETPRCARVRPDRVDETACIEGAFNAYAWDTAPLPAGSEACRGGTVEATRDDRLGLVLCWRLLQHPG